MATFLKSELVGKYIVYNNGGGKFLMCVTSVDNRRISGDNTIILEPVKGDFIGRDKLFSCKGNFTLYLDGDKVSNVKIITEAEYKVFKDNYLAYMEAKSNLDSLFRFI